MNTTSKLANAQINSKKNLEDIYLLLKHKLAQATHSEVNTINLALSISDYLADSVKLVRFAASICDELNIDFEPALLIDFENLHEIADKLYTMHIMGDNLS